VPADSSARRQGSHSRQVQFLLIRTATTLLTMGVRKGDSASRQHCKEAGLTQQTGANPFVCIVQRSAFQLRPSCQSAVLCVVQLVLRSKLDQPCAKTPHSAGRTQHHGVLFLRAPGTFMSCDTQTSYRGECARSPASHATHTYDNECARSPASHATHTIWVALTPLPVLHGWQLQEAASRCGQV